MIPRGKDASGASIKITEKQETGVERTVVNNRDQKRAQGQPQQVSDLASVGLSLSVGMATEFGQEKIEVSGWCTLPCDPNDVAIKAAYDECYVQIMEQIIPKLEDAKRTFFPELTGEQH